MSFLDTAGSPIEYEVVNYRDMLTIIYERIEDAIARGLSLEEVKTARFKP